jgi:hypothetical protein
LVASAALPNAALPPSCHREFTERSRVLFCRLCCLLSALLTIASASFVATGARAVYAQALPKAASKSQGSGTKFVLSMDFIEKYADRVTIETDFRVARVGHKHPQDKDGEVHIGGVAKEAKLPTVAELTNPETEDINHFLDLASKNGVSSRTVPLKGAWRLWTEHPGTLPQEQGASLPDRFADSNPDHVFEIHPITAVGDRSLLHTFRPIPEFPPNDANVAFLAYENTKCRIRKNASNVEITANGVGFNFVEFILEIGDLSQHEVDDGRMVLCQVRDTEGELLIRRRRMVFVKGTQPELRVRQMQEGDRIRVIGIPRINLRLMKWLWKTRARTSAIPKTRSIGTCLTKSSWLACRRQKTIE